MRGDARPGPDSDFDARLSLGDFVVGQSDDPLTPPAGFTEWREAGAWEAELYEPNMLASADARTQIEYDGKVHPVINLCSYNYLGLANHPEIVAAAIEALRKYGVGACGSPTLSGMTDLHRKLERAVAQFL
nr:aminotransferase class I/II-fold pyridoxal phosphate-dependent enzyme [Chthoniobacterales bacterium]